MSPPGSSPCGTKLCTDWAFWSPAKGRVAAVFLEAQLLSRLVRRRGNSTGATCLGPELPEEGSISGGAPGGVAPLPFSCSPDTCDTWSGLDIRAKPEEDRDGSLQGEWVQKKAQRRLSAFLPLRWPDVIQHESQSQPALPTEPLVTIIESNFLWFLQGPGDLHAVGPVSSVLQLPHG